MLQTRDDRHDSDAANLVLQKKVKEILLKVEKSEQAVRDLVLGLGCSIATAGPLVDTS